MTFPKAKPGPTDWLAVDATERDAIGSNDNLKVGDTCILDDGSRYRCNAVTGGDTSTWLGTGALEVFVPANGTATRGDHSVDNVPNAANGFIEIAIPLDMKVFVTIELLIIPTATNATADLDLNTDVGAVGEVFNTHSGADAATTYNLVIDEIFSIDLLPVVAFAAFGDLIGIKFTNNSGAAIDLLGVRLRYTA